MDRVNDRTYVGRPGEAVGVTTKTSGGGQATVILEGVDMGPNAQFSLPSSGGRRDWEVALIGPLGAKCRVEIRVVNGDADIDLLMCQTHNPAPVSFYTASAPVLAPVRSVRTRAMATSRTSSSAAKKAKARAAARRAAAKKPTHTRSAAIKTTRRNETTAKTAARTIASRKSVTKGPRPKKSATKKRSRGGRS